MVAEVARGEIWGFAFPRPGVASEVVVGTEVGLKQPSAINLHHLATVPRAGLRSYVGTVPRDTMLRVRDALLFALGFAGPPHG